MRLRRVTVTNFRALANLTFVPSRYTVLVGENATGKTCVLHALRLLFDPDARRLVADLSEDDVHRAALKAGTRSFSVEVEIGDVQKHPELQAAFDRSIAIEKAEQYVTIQGLFAPDDASNGDLIWSTWVLPPPGSKADQIAFTPRMARLMPLYYLDAVRDASRETRPTGRTLLGRLLDEVSLDDVADDLKKAVIDANCRLQAANDVSTLAADLTRLVRPHTHGGNGELRFVLASEDANSVLKAVRLVLQAGGDALDLSRHATGLQNLVLVALFRHLVAQATEVFPIFACEEPESHLHPHAQRRLARELGDLPGPTIVTTHCAVFVEKIDPICLVRLAHGPSGLLAHQCASVGQREREDFAQFMRSGRGDALFARSLLVVEGEQEMIALPAFASLLNLDLERDGVALVRADGNTFGFLLRALGETALNIPITVTYDTDALSHDNKVVDAAYKGGVLPQVDADSVRKAAGAQRQDVLTKIGWIAAEPNFEGQVCEHGYCDIAFRLIAEEGAHKRFGGFLNTKRLCKDASSAARFIAENKTLKIPLARAVAAEAPSVKMVPPCYKIALERAVERATG